ncbi:uncharacterized protein LOC119518736 isoform X2 [Choloepus didactylus]|uniref:uncharacterized protein LOC119518736 isoform X2 n=1 Tax=Choloepus didactylus TaxID=27675 RepID=UPI00189F7F3C|nr:uncharacterized protein LOC119518736 isoform X2 [Choloepus didactylus]
MERSRPRPKMQGDPAGASQRASGASGDVALPSPISRRVSERESLDLGAGHWGARRAGIFETHWPRSWVDHRSSGPRGRAGNSRPPRATGKDWKGVSERESAAGGAGSQSPLRRSPETPRRSDAEQPAQLKKGSAPGTERPPG